MPLPNREKTQPNCCHFKLASAKKSWSSWGDRHFYILYAILTTCLVSKEDFLSRHSAGMRSNKLTLPQLHNIQHQLYVDIVRASKQRILRN